MSSDWQCEVHGKVAPYHRGSLEALSQIAGHAGVPLWSPLPLLTGWTATGVGWCGDERTSSCATLMAFSGPSPLGGPADLIVVAEDLGVGLGARVAGLGGVDPGLLVDGAPDAKILAAGHPTPLWRCASTEESMAFVGEAMGVWLWVVVWPPAAELVLLEHVELHDLRHDAHVGLGLPLGAASPRMP